MAIEHLSTTVTVTHGGRLGHDLSDVAPPGSFSADLASRLGLLWSLDHWLRLHGAMTPGSGLRVHVTHDDEPAEQAEPIDGAPVAACRIAGSIEETPPATS